MKINKFSLENDLLKIEVIPELGGRISSLIYKPTEKNWIWSNETIGLKKIDNGIDYDNNWQGGWEELFPNDAIEQFSWGEGYDHGELWFNSWNIIDYSEFQLVLGINNLESKTKFLKTISINKSKLKVSYSAEISFFDHFLFKLHLAIPIEDSLKKLIDQSKIEKVESDFGNILGTENENYFLNPKKNTGLYDFGYFDTSANLVEVIDKKNNKLKLTFDKNILKYFWIFQSQGGWNQHNVLVLEPCTNGKKIISDAVQSNQSIKGPTILNTHYSVEVSNL